MKSTVTAIFLSIAAIAALGKDDATEDGVRRIGGYKGIWFDLGQKSEFGSKYSGGLGTYTGKHCPLAVYAPAVRKTFFVYGGTTSADERHLLAMASYYDHETKEVPKPVVVHDYRSEKRLVYMKDIGFDAKGNPVILYITSSSYQPGPQGDPRTWTIAHWSGKEWQFREVTKSTHNYDMGSLYIEDDNVWRIIGPTEPGPQKYGTGGEIAVWVSKDEGVTWKKTGNVTHDSVNNHGYVRRPVNAQPDFYGFWGDGNPDKMTESRLYFTDKEGSQAWKLPYNMDDAMVSPTTIEAD